jgi:AbrB family looped-hinge helix DNA binding protein
MRAMVSLRGRVTIPKPLRTRLGITAGTVLNFEAQNGELIARRVDLTDPTDAAWGILSLDESADQFVDRLRGGRL